jgi:hypothetical protein
MIKTFIFASAILLMNVKSSADVLSFEGHPFVLDFTSFGDRDLSESKICQRTLTPDAVTAEGTPIQVLGLAVTYFAPGYQTSPLGHVGLRVVYCYGEFLNDRLFEWTQFLPAEEANFKKTYPGIDLAAQRAQLQHSLYMKMTENPAQYLPSEGVGYGRYQFISDRNVFESWLDLESPAKYKVLHLLSQEWTQQGQSLKSNQPLQKYDKFKNSCVTKALEVLSSALSPIVQRKMGSPVLPLDLFRRLSGNVSHFGILYPSQRTLRMIWRDSKAPDLKPQGPIDRSPLLVNPYGKVSEPNYQENLAAGLINTPASAAEMVIASGESLAQGNLQPIKQAALKFSFSVLEILGWTFIHPAPTPWSPAELNWMKTASKDTPAVVQILNLPPATAN